MNLTQKATFIIFLFFAMCFPHSPSHATATEDYSHEIARISMDIKNRPLKDILQTISEETGYTIEVNDDLLDTSVSGIFVDTDIVVIMSRILRKKNVFILENTEQRLITIRSSDMSKRKSSFISSSTGNSKSSAHSSQKSLDLKLSQSKDSIEVDPGVTYQDLLTNRENLEQHLANNKETIETSPGVSYQDLLNAREKLDKSFQNDKNTIETSPGVSYQDFVKTQKKLDTHLSQNSAAVEISPGVSYQDLKDTRARLDKMLQERKK